MTRCSKNPVLIVAVLTAAALFAGCGGGGGGGGGGGSVAAAAAQRIDVKGLTSPIYVGGAAPLPACPIDVKLNAPIRFKFGGVVDLTSVPADGPAIGSIQITSIQTINGNQQVVPAFGNWTADPLDSHTVIFSPLPPTNSSQGCVAGLTPGQTYTINIPTNLGGSQQTVKIDGIPNQTAVNTCFTTIACNNGNPTPALIDPVDGSPTIVSTNPPTSAAAPAITTAQLTPSGNGTKITIDVSEPLSPVSVINATFQLFDLTANQTVPIRVAGVVNFLQTGTVPGGTGTISRIEFVTTRPLADGDTYEIQSPNTSPIVDLGNNPLVIPAGSLRFSVVNNNDDLAFSFFDDFVDTSNLGTISTNIQWNGNGRVEATFPSNIVGTGADGAGVFTGSTSVNTNSSSGLFNYSTLVVGVVATSTAATVTFTSASNDPATAVSNFAVQLRSTSTITIVTNSVLNLNGNQGTAGLINTQVPGFGGWGGPGGGPGGNGSPDANVANPDPFGGPGTGGRTALNNVNIIGGTLNTTSSSVLFGGGAGGVSGVLGGTTGPSGGGGGSASNLLAKRGTAGESQNGAGAPAGGAAGPLPAAFIPPITAPVGGSGGGAGGEQVATGANPLPANSDRGGAGGGGGGAIRISGSGTISIGQFVAINCKGGHGGIFASTFVAKGAGGSGGSILIQTFGDVAVGVGINFNCDNGIGNGGTTTAALDGDGGNGGEGLIQIEDSDGVYPNLASGIQVGETFTQQFQLISAINGTATSRVIDTGSFSTDYVQTNGQGSTTASTTAGVGGVTVTVIGIQEDPLNPGNPATATPSLVSAPVSLANIAQINGYRYFQFVIATTFPPPPASNTSSVLPRVDFIQVVYNR